ncbi:MAG: hypothetical protein P8Y97_20515 [Candidatus Lokiarchaeota archaeon]
MSEEEKKNEYDFKSWTVKDLREFASANNIAIPSKSARGRYFSSRICRQNKRRKF